MMSQGRSRWTRALRWLGVAFIAGLAWLGIVVALIIAAGRPQPERTADVAIVLGAAVIGSRPSPVFAARLDHAIALWQTNRVGYLVLTGGRSPEDALSEAEAGRRYAIAQGVPAEAIWTESISSTTWENLREAKKLLDAHDVKTALLVSDPLHMCRSHMIAYRLGLTAQTSPTPSSRYRSLGLQAKFLAKEVVFLHADFLARHSD